jgi:hypothetical protein
MRIKRFNEESMFDEGGQSYKLVEDFIKEHLNNNVDPVDQEDLSNLLIEFGKKVWLHLSAEGWGESSLNGYEEWLNKGSK